MSPPAEHLTLSPRPVAVAPVAPLRDEFRLQVRDRALDAAAAEVLQHGWQHVRLAQVARSTGISRATLHRSFGGRDGLAAALVAREGERVLLRIDRSLREARGWESGLHAALSIAVRVREDHPLVAAVLEGRHDDASLLPLVATRTTLVADARSLVCAFLRQHRARLTQSYLDDVADTLVRATMSHVLLPESDDRAIDRLERLARHLLTHPPQGALRTTGG